MGRKRTRLKLTPAQRHTLERLLRATGDGRLRERLRFAVRASEGQHTLEGLARGVGRSRSTIQNWLAKFQTGGLEGLLDRNTPPGMESPLASGVIQAEISAGIESGQFKTAAHIAAWLRERHGINRSRKSIYYWLRKNGSRR